jgi:hypothetical protein
MPQSGTIPRAMAAAAVASGIVSGRVASSAMGTPRAACVSATASTTTSHSAAAQRSGRGKSSTTQPSARHGSIIALKHAVSAARSPQM